MKAALLTAKSPRTATRQIVELRNPIDATLHHDHTRAVEPLEARR